MRGTFFWECGCNNFFTQWTFFFGCLLTTAMVFLLILSFPYKSYVMWLVYSPFNFFINLLFEKFAWSDLVRKLNFLKVVSELTYISSWYFFKLGGVGNINGRMFFFFLFVENSSQSLIQFGMHNIWRCGQILLFKEIVKKVEWTQQIAPKSVNADTSIVTNSVSLFSIKD